MFRERRTTMPEATSVFATRKIPGIVFATKWVLTRCLFGKPPLMRGFYTKGRCPLVVVTGDNGSGKSLVRRMYCAWASKRGVEQMPFSMQFRSGGGFERAIIFGSEDWEATGIISASAFLKSISSSANRTNPHLIVWDEPDLGLSEGYSLGMGKEIRRFISNPPKYLWGAVLMTHSKGLLGEAVNGLKPHHLALDENVPLNEWLERREPARPIDGLLEMGLRRFRAISKFLKD